MYTRDVIEIHNFKKVQKIAQITYVFRYVSKKPQKIAQITHVIPIRFGHSASCHPERSEGSQQQSAEMRGFHVELV